MDEDWVRTARAKGLSEKRVIRRHVLRNGLIPPVNIWGLDFSHAFGGFALYVEVIFGLPGVGALTADTIGTFDLPPIVALAVYLAIVVVLTSAARGHRDRLARSSDQEADDHRPEPTPGAVTLDPLSPMNRDLDYRDGPRDECGVFGVYAPERDVARLAYFALFALQHRGQESAGIAATAVGPDHDRARPRARLAGLRRGEAARAPGRDGDRPRALLDDGLVGVGERAAGVALGPPPGGARPQRQPDQRGRAARRAAASSGVQFRGTSDSEIIAALLSTHEADRIEDAVADVMPRLEGAFSTVVMTKDAVVAFRDPAGLRPLSLGMLGERLLRRLRELRLRHHRRRAAARGAAGRDGLAGRARDRDAPGGGLARGARSACSSTSTSRGRTRSSRATARRCRAARWARSSGARRRSRRTW